jgi:hypothetical protein
MRDGSVTVESAGDSVRCDVSKERNTVMGFMLPYAGVNKA